MSIDQANQDASQECWLQWIDHFHIVLDTHDVLLAEGALSLRLAGVAEQVAAAARTSK